MGRSLAMVAAAIGVVAMPVVVYAGSEFTLKSVSVELPAGDRLYPPGPNVEVINDNCLACHSAGMVLYQPAMPTATWEAEVKKMIGVYGAPVAPEAVPQIVAYLAAVKGTPTPAGSATK